jgi:hypothetical protein
MSLRAMYPKRPNVYLVHAGSDNDDTKFNLNVLRLDIHQPLMTTTA